jgi:DNA-binding NarL/FixJ family response regulator
MVQVSAGRSHLADRSPVDRERMHCDYLQRMEHVQTNDDDITPHVHGGVSIRVLIIEDDPRIRQSLEQVVRSNVRFTVSGTASDIASARRALREHHDVALVDLRLPDGSGIDLIREISAGGKTRSIVISVFGDEASVISALEAGADGYLLKDSTDVADSILQVVQGGAPMSPAIAAHLLRRFRGPRPAAAPADLQPARAVLAPRELALLECLARGLSYREAAQELTISHHTVADYVKAIYRKLSVNSRGEAVFEAVRTGLIRMERPAV